MCLMRRDESESTDPSRLDALDARELEREAVRDGARDDLGDELV